jgi:uncharacterized protein YcbK (DUF882 family)
MTRVALATVITAMLGSAAHAAPDPAHPSKKDRERAGKSTTHGAVLAPGTKPAKLVNLYNGWTNEWLAVDPGSPPSRPGMAPAQATIDRFLRDHFTNMSTTMEPRLIGILVAAAQSFKSPTITVVSGFRHPKYNLILRKKGHQVARDSQHTHGNAVDFYVPPQSPARTREMQAWAKSQKIGGVGLYLESGFVHMDTGKIRFWSGE